MPELSRSRAAARLKIAEEHFRTENHHDLDGILNTFGQENQVIDDVAGNQQHVGYDNVRAYYAGLFEAFPDLRYEVQRMHVAEDVIIAEFIVSGTHIQSLIWMFQPPGNGLRSQLAGFSRLMTKIS